VRRGRRYSLSVRLQAPSPKSNRGHVAAASSDICFGSCVGPLSQFANIGPDFRCESSCDMAGRQRRVWCHPDSGPRATKVVRLRSATSEHRIPQPLTLHSGPSPGLGSAKMPRTASHWRPGIPRPKPPNSERADGPVNRAKRPLLSEVGQFSRLWESSSELDREGWATWLEPAPFVQGMVRTAGTTTGSRVVRASAFHEG